MVSDEFFATNKYSWDLVLVFPPSAVKSGSFESRVDDLHAAGLETRCFYGKPKEAARRAVFCQVRAALPRLAHHADYVNQPVPLNAGEARRRLEAGDAARGVAPRRLPHDPEFSRLPPFAHLHAKYDTEPGLQALYAPAGPDPLEPGRPHGFRAGLRLQLLQGIMRMDKEEGGAALAPRELLAQGELEAFYPLHSEVAAQWLKAEWLPWGRPPWRQPLDQIKDYFGEQMGLYFAFLGHYAAWLGPCALSGAALGAATYGEWHLESPAQATFGLAIAIWGVLMLEFWKRRQAFLALRWGTYGFKSDLEAAMRPEFQGLLRPSPLTGEEGLYFPRRRAAVLLCQSASVVGSMIVAVLACVWAIFALKWYLQYKSGTSWGETYGSSIGSAVNAVQIQILNSWYKSVAVFLNDRENHQTDIGYQDALISKLFLFQGVNSYSSFFYIAFIQEQAGIPCEAFNEDSCVYLLLQNLVVIFGFQLVAGNLIEVLLPCLKGRLAARRAAAARRRGRGGQCAAPLPPGPAERELALAAYDEVMDLLMDYGELALQFGFMTLFVSVFPFAPLLGLLNNWVEIRSDGYKLLNHHQRTNPAPAEDIGTWQTIFELLAGLSVLSNAALVCFVMTEVFPDGYTLSTRQWLFCSFVGGVAGLTFLMQAAVPDQPHEVTHQLRRQELAARKLVERAADENEEHFVPLPRAARPAVVVLEDGNGGGEGRAPVPVPVPVPKGSREGRGRGRWGARRGAQQGGHRHSADGNCVEGRERQQRTKGKPTPPGSGAWGKGWKGGKSRQRAGPAPSTLPRMITKSRLEDDPAESRHQVASEDEISYHSEQQENSGPRLDQNEQFLLHIDVDNESEVSYYSEEEAGGVVVKQKSSNYIL